MKVYYMNLMRNFVFCHTFQLVRFKNTIAVSVWEILRKLDGIATKVKVMNETNMKMEIFN